VRRKSGFERKTEISVSLFDDENDERIGKGFKIKGDKKEDV